MMDASVQDLFYLGLDKAGGGDTTVTLCTVGSTWTLTPTLLLDANVGSNKMNHQSSGPDYGTNYGLDCSAFPGRTARASRAPVRRISSATAACRCSTPACRRSATTPAGRRCGATRSATRSRSTSRRSTGGTRSARASTSSGSTLDHWQPEIDNPRGNFTFGGSITGTPGFTRPASAAGTATPRSCSVR